MKVNYAPQLYFRYFARNAYHEQFKPFYLDFTALCLAKESCRRDWRQSKAVKGDRNTERAAMSRKGTTVR